MYAVVFYQFKRCDENFEQEAKPMIEQVEQQLGNYRSKQVLGRGAFADVYLGEHLYLSTPLW